MSTWKLVLIMTALAVVPTPESWADRLTESTSGGSPSYGPAIQCKVVYRAPKPALELAEDCLAYLLDIPLAMLSPLTCPVVAPLMEKFDSGPSRSYCSPARR
jgi:hypothetical protein